MATASVYGRKTWMDDAIDGAVQGISNGIAAVPKAFSAAGSAVNKGYSTTLGNNGIAGSGAPTYADDPYAVDPAPVAASIRKIASSVTPPAITGPTALPGNIRGYANSQNADGSGTLTAPRRTAKRSITSIATAPATVAVPTAATPSITELPESAGYGEYTGDPGSRIAAGTAMRTAPQPIAGIASIAQPATVDMSPGSQGEWEANQGVINRIAALSPDLNKMSMSDLLSYNKGIKALGITSQANQNAASARHLDLTGNLAALELPSKINQNIATANHLETTSGIAALKAPAEVDNIRAVTAQHQALTNETNNLLGLKAKNLISEIDYRTGMLGIGNKKLDLLTKQYDAKLLAMKSTKAEPDYKLISGIAQAKMKTYQEINALGGLTPEQTLDMQKQNDILNLVQRHATKSSTQYAVSATTATDDET